MNGKKAKKLRRQAREYSVGMPEVKYNLTKNILSAGRNSKNR